WSSDVCSSDLSRDRGIATLAGKGELTGKAVSPMHPQLQLVADEYRSAQARLHDLVHAVPDGQWGKRSDPARWSVAECVAHLNITSLAYVPLLQHAVSRARMLERRSPSRYRRDPSGWLLWATMGPPVRFRIKTDRKSTRLNSSHVSIS